MSADPYNLRRFVDAQQPVYDTVCDELRRGVKETHWMWFIFPQIQGLGHSPIAKKFAIASLGEAKAFLKHPVLGPRLVECTRLVQQIRGRTIQQVFGYPDDLKFHSSMTLFSRATDENDIFESVIRKYFDGRHDNLTIERI